MRETVKLASGEKIDLKAYEADMRHLIDTYIEADEPRKISEFDNLSLIELIVKSGIADAIGSRLGAMKNDKRAIAEIIENNIRSKIIKEHLIDPEHYETLSAVLAEIIAERKADAIEYEEYLQRIAKLAEDLHTGHSPDMPIKIDTPGKRALYSNLGKDEELALKIHETVMAKKPDGWRGIQAKEQVLKGAINVVLEDSYEVERIFPIIKAHKEYW